MSGSPWKPRGMQPMHGRLGWHGHVTHALQALCMCRGSFRAASHAAVEAYAANYMTAPAGADDAELLSNVTLHAARSADGGAVGRYGRLRLLPLPTPRWPDLLVAHAPEDRCRAGRALRAGRARHWVAVGIVSSSSAQRARTWMHTAVFQRSLPRIACAGKRPVSWRASSRAAEALLMRCRHMPHRSARHARVDCQGSLSGVGSVHMRGRSEAACPGAPGCCSPASCLRRTSRRRRRARRTGTPATTPAGACMAPSGASTSTACSRPSRARPPVRPSPAPLLPARHGAELRPVASCACKACSAGQ